MIFEVLLPFYECVVYYLTEVSSTRWQFITMTAQEEDLIHRMHKLIGDRQVGFKETQIFQQEWI